MSKLSPESTSTIERRETEPVIVVKHLGSLEQFKLGNPDGIRGRLAHERVTHKELIDFGETLKKAVDRVTDVHHAACIDGRSCKCNSDGSAAEIRRRQVAGTNLNTEVALNGESPLLEGEESDQLSVEELFAFVDDAYEKLTSVKPSAHLGGCGGAKGVVEDNEHMAENGASVEVAEAIMNLKSVADYSRLSFTEEYGNKVRANAAKTAKRLKAGGYSGPAYIANVENENPAGVEDLEVDEADHEFHGHQENAIVFVLSFSGKETLSKQKMEELGLGQAFVINIDASVDSAKALSRKDPNAAVDEDRAAQLLIANIAKHAEVAHRLAHKLTPVYFMEIQ